MNSFYSILSVVITVGAALGYILGGLRIAAAFIKTFIYTSTVYFLFEPLASWLVSYCNMDFLYAGITAAISILLICFLFIRLLIAPVLKKISVIHTHTINRITGMMTGFVVSAIACLFFVQYYGTVAIPPELPGHLLQKNITAAIYQQAEFITDKMAALPNRQPMQVMAAKETSPVKEEGVQLPFSTSSLTISPPLEREMLELVNMEREKKSLKPLSFDSALTKAARLHAADMLQRGYFSHFTPEGLDPFQRLRKLNIHYRYAGENLALAPALIQAHQGLMKSPGHKSNILHPSYGRVGIGIIDGGIYGLMIAQEFSN
jgi:uncharacterized protein YkwD